MNWKYKENDTVFVNPTQSDLKYLSDTKGYVVRRLAEEEADFCETGPMYHVRLTWPHEGKELDVFEDELRETPELEFERMVDVYRAKGYRIVAFEKECEGGWIMVFDTHGKDATEFPKEAFKVPASESWERFYGWDILDEDTRIFDDTDDPQFLTDSYDFTANLPVFQLADNYR